MPDTTRRLLGRALWQRQDPIVHDRTDWRANPNHWHAITRLWAVVQVGHIPPCAVLAVKPTRAEARYGPRRTHLAFTRWVVRRLLCDDLGVFSALMAAFAARTSLRSSSARSQRPECRPARLRRHLRSNASCHLQSRKTISLSSKYSPTPSRRVRL